MSTDPSTDPTTPATGPAPHPSRRGLVLGGIGLPLLAACGGDDTDGTDGTDGNGDAGNGEAGGDTGENGGTSGATVATADVPVGGGVILPDEKVVVTQPAEGEFKAFTAVCTHQQCTVTTVEEGTINCPCHGSMFSVEDGSVAGGPAPAPLEEVPFSVEGEEIVLG